MSTPDKEAKNNEEETKAAVVLQSNYRGYKERKKFKEKKKTTAGAELELPPNKVVEDEGGKESTNKEEEGEKIADKQRENEEDEESTYKAEENDDSDHTQVPEDDEHTEVVDEAIIEDAPATHGGKEGQVANEKEENAQENAAVEETVTIEEDARAATVIQSNFRGHKERKRLQEEGKIPAKKQKDKIPSGEENVPEVQIPAEETEKESAEEADVSVSDEDETRAAVVIQSNFRGHKERKRLEEEGKIPKKRKKENDGTLEPTKEDKQVAQTEESLQDASAEKPEGMDEGKAATVLQSNFRGQRDRKKLKEEREAQNKAKEEAVIPNDAEEKTKMEAEDALDITDVVIERKEETDADAEQQKLEEEQAAVKIQSNFRGYKERKNLKANKQEAEQLQSFSKEVTASFFHNQPSLSCYCFHSEYIVSVYLFNRSQRLLRSLLPCSRS